MFAELMFFGDRNFYSVTLIGFLNLICLDTVELVEFKKYGPVLSKLEFG